jgi:hypothetical protein
MGLWWASISSLLFPGKSVILAFERMVAEALDGFGSFLQKLRCVATWADFENRPKQPFRNLRPFDSRVANPGDSFLL